MSSSPRRGARLGGCLLGSALLFALAACSGGGMSQAEVQEMVDAAVAGIPAPQPGVAPADAERIAQGVVADAERVAGVVVADAERIARGVVADAERIAEGVVADAERIAGGVAPADAERIARGVVAAIPPRSDLAEYTKFFVESAISRYETQGLDATLAHYNRSESVDGQWYAFIIDDRGLVIGHPDPGRLGLDLKGWVGTDVNGYTFGEEMLSATEDGKWVSYVYRNPENGGLGSGAFDLKNVWVVRHDGLLFASGWYIDADEFTKQLVSVAVDEFRSGGLAATVAYFASPGSSLAGLVSAVDYYNSAETVDGEWSAFIADPDGSIVAHSDPETIGQDIQDWLGAATLDTADTTEEGRWVTSDSVRFWVASYDGHLLGSGWRSHDSN